MEDLGEVKGYIRQDLFERLEIYSKDTDWPAWDIIEIILNKHLEELLDEGEAHLRKYKIEKASERYPLPSYLKNVRENFFGI